MGSERRFAYGVVPLYGAAREKVFDMLLCQVRWAYEEIVWLEVWKKAHKFSRRGSRARTGVDEGTFVMKIIER
jgi:hypothetical protein